MRSRESFCAVAVYQGNDLALDVQLEDSYVQCNTSLDAHSGCLEKFKLNDI